MALLNPGVFQRMTLHPWMTCRQHAARDLSSVGPAGVVALLNPCVFQRMTCHPWITCHQRATRYLSSVGQQAAGNVRTSSWPLAAHADSRNNRRTHARGAFRTKN